MPVDSETPKRLSPSLTTYVPDGAFGRDVALVSLGFGVVGTVVVDVAATAVSGECRAAARAPNRSTPNSMTAKTDRITRALGSVPNPAEAAAFDVRAAGLGATGSFPTLGGNAIGCWRVPSAGPVAVVPGSAPQR